MGPASKENSLRKQVYFIIRAGARLLDFRPHTAELCWWVAVEDAIIWSRISNIASSLPLSG